MTEKKDGSWFADGEAYEHYVGRWSRPVGQMFLDWLAPAPGLRWADVGCGTGALSETILSKADPERVSGSSLLKVFLTAPKQALRIKGPSSKSAMHCPCRWMITWLMSWYQALS
jgi:hypothetical protein